MKTYNKNCAFYSRAKGQCTALVSSYTRFGETKQTECAGCAFFETKDERDRNVRAARHRLMQLEPTLRRKLIMKYYSLHGLMEMTREENET